MTALQTCGDGACSRRLTGLNRAFVADSKATKTVGDRAHTVLYTYLLGSVQLQESRPPTTSTRYKREAAARFRAGLQIIVPGVGASPEGR